MAVLLRAASLALHSQRYDAGNRLILENCRGVIADCSFADGATRLTGNGTVLQRKSLYTQIDGGAVLIVGHADLIFRGCTFTGNHSAMCGGAVSLQAARGSRFVFEDCMFTDNTADDTGPAIDVLTDGLMVTLRHCTFTDNRSTGRLTSLPIGQVSVFPGNDLVLKACTFQGNEVDVDYHEQPSRRVTITTDTSYKLRDTTSIHNARQLRKIVANAQAFIAHPLHYPRV